MGVDSPPLGRRYQRPRRVAASDWLVTCVRLSPVRNTDMVAKLAVLVFLLGCHSTSPTRTSANPAGDTAAATPGDTSLGSPAVQPDPAERSLPQNAAQRPSTPLAGSSPTTSPPARSPTPGGAPPAAGSG